MNEEKLYCSYDDYAVIYDTANNTFTCRAGELENVIDAGRIAIRRTGDGKDYSLSEFRTCNYERKPELEENVLRIIYDGSDLFKYQLSLEFRLSRYGIKITVFGIGENVLHIKGNAQWGSDAADNTFPMCIGRSGSDIRAALGPAASKADNSLYDRLSDSALCIKGGKEVRFKFNWDRKAYGFELKTGLVEYQQRFLISVKKDIIADEYGISYAPINKKSVFKKPPAGWMTWYAVRFNASEKTVRENTLFQEKYFKEYGADAIWVDWEWYHKSFSGERDDGCDTFHPDREKYPKGLRAVSENIVNAGFTPCLWIGYTHDSSHNKFTKEHPEMILKEKISWCGKYFYDMSSPVYLEEFLPEALRQVKAWGYKAVKFDTLPIIIDYHEENHMNMHDPSLTTKQVFRNAMKKTREQLGSDVYMLACAAVKDADILWAADIFDAARVGNDIFEWNDFIKEGVMRTLKFYAMHNMVLYADPDNLIVREELNDKYQAASRAYFVSMLGLPMTFGDNLPELSQDRVKLIQSCLPVLDIHPMDIRKPITDNKVLLSNLFIEKPWESYNVISVFNLTNEKADKTVYLDKDLQLDGGEYFIFDYNSERLSCITDDSIYVSMQPCESRIFAVRKKTGGVQLLSTSRHISQGAAEIEHLCMNEEKCSLQLECNLVKADLYSIFLYVPQEYELCEAKGFTDEGKVGNVRKLSFLPDKTGTYKFEINFNKI